MPSLTAERTDYRLALVPDHRRFWVVGRDPTCELLLTDRGISRFHAILFHIEGRFSVIDHSLNGTHVFRGEEEYRTARQVPDRPLLNGVGDDGPDVVSFETTEIEPVEFLPLTVTGGEGMPIEMHASYTELKIAQRESRVPRIAGYVPHERATRESLDALLAMLENPDDAATLASMGRALEAGDVLLFHGFDRHFFRFGA